MPETQPWVPLSIPDPRTTVAQRLTEVAAALPDQPALVSPGQCYTFAEVERLTGRLAVLLAELTADEGPGDDAAPVALVADQDAAAVLMFLALLRSGRTAVVLDATLPEARLAQIARQAGVRACVSDRPVDLSGGGLAVAVHDLGELVARAESVDLPAAEALPVGADPACVVFTSGSTGRPKGVTYLHRTLFNEAYAARTRLDFSPGDRTALVLPYAFAAGLAVVVMALLNGAGLYVFDPRVRGVRGLPAWLAEQRVTTAHFTPSLLRSLLGVLGPEAVLEDLRVVTTCGEAVYGRDVTALRPHLSPRAVFTSWSGSSEMGHLAFYRIGPEDPVPAGIVPVGEPAPNKTVVLVGDDGAPVPVGETGEVVMTSAYLTAGYWRQPEATAERFAFLDDGTTRYRTGDLARFDAEGRLHLLGRNDSAVKVRGYLVEPAEIEAALLGEEDVAEAVVGAVKRPPAATRLVAYVAPSPRHRAPSTAELRRRLRRALPEWMVPSAIVQLDALPRNERGKIDREALPPVPERVEGPPPRSEWEVVLADLWCRVLELDAVGRDEGFGELGGDSLAVEELLAATAERFGVELTAGQFAQAQVLSEFAELVASQARRAPDGGAKPEATAVVGPPSRIPARYASTVIGLRERGDRPGLFCFTGAGAGALSFAALARCLSEEQPVYALQQHGLEGRAVPSWTVAAAARRHVRAIRAVQPNGPYVLAGHSLGGLVAVAAARQLAAAGAAVPLVVVIDALLPRAVRRRFPAAVLDRPVLPQPAVLPTRELWRRRLRLPLAGVVRADMEWQSGNLEELGRRVAEFHRPRPWAGPAVVYQSHENPDAPDWWRSVLTGEVDLRTVACDHASIVREPHVAGVAARLDADIAGALAAGVAR